MTTFCAKTFLFNSVIARSVHVVRKRSHCGVVVIVNGYSIQRVKIKQKTPHYAVFFEDMITH